MASLIFPCINQSLRLLVTRYVSIIPRLLKTPYVKIRVKFNGKKIPILLPLDHLESAILNLKHVFIDCDYFQVDYAIPKSNSIIIDCGGFLGYYTIAVSQFLSERGVIHVFEPNPFILPILTRNIEMGVNSKVYIYPRALCTERGQVKLYIGENPAVTSIIRDHVEEFTSIKSIINVKCIKLSTLLKHIGRVDIIKLDVEGVELELLREASSELRRAESLVIEVHRDLVDTVEIEKLLVNLGFGFFVIYTSNEMPYQVIFYAKKIN
jgi:FkbM family methyltransferase